MKIRIKLLSLFAFASLLTSSCLNSKTQFCKETDRVVVSFYAKADEGGIDRSYLVKEFTEKTDIDKFCDVISSSNAPNYKCAYSGSIDYYKNGVSLLDEKAEFNLNPDCTHIVFIFKEKMYSKKLTKKGIEFLNSFYKKVPEEKRI